MAPQRDTASPARRLALVAVLLISAAAGEVKKDKGTSPARKLEKSFLLEPQTFVPTCPPPDFFYESCYMAREFVEYRNRHSQHRFEHEVHFRPVAGPPQLQPRPAAQLPKPLLPPADRPSVITLVAEEAQPARRDPWFQPGHKRGHGPPAHRPRWQGAAGRDNPGWRESK